MCRHAFSDFLMTTTSRFAVRRFGPCSLTDSFRGGRDGCPRAMRSRRFCRRGLLAGTRRWGRRIRGRRRARTGRLPSPSAGAVRSKGIWHPRRTMIRGWSSTGSRRLLAGCERRTWSSTSRRPPRLTWRAIPACTRRSHRLWRTS